MSWHAPMIIRAITERDGINDCQVSTTPIQVGRPDLLIAAVNDPSPTAAQGADIQVSATVRNPTSFNATPTFRVRYPLSSLDELQTAGTGCLPATGPWWGWRPACPPQRVGAGDDPGLHAHPATITAGLRG